MFQADAVCCHASGRAVRVLLHTRLHTDTQTHRQFPNPTSNCQCKLSILEYLPRRKPHVCPPVQAPVSCHTYLIAPRLAQFHHIPDLIIFPPTQATILQDSTPSVNQARVSTPMVFPNRLGWKPIPFSEGPAATSMSQDTARGPCRSNLNIFE